MGKKLSMVGELYCESANEKRQGKKIRVGIGVWIIL